MLQGKSRENAKRLLSRTRMKLVYDRITLTRYTTLYFFFTLVTCLVLSALQGVLLYDNTQAVNILTDVVDEAQVPAHIAMVMQDHLQDNKVVEVEEVTNDSLIGGSGAQGGFSLNRRRFRRRRRTTRVHRQVVEEEEEEDSASSDEGEVSSDDEGGVSSSDEEGAESDDDDEDTSTGTVATATVIATTVPSGTSQAAATSTSTPPRIPLPVETINTSGQKENLHDAQREDVATLFFQLWLFTIGLVAILNESLPHLGAAFFGHVLGGAWATSRITSTKNLVAFYSGVIVDGPCRGYDPLGPWWNVRLEHTVYAGATFSRVGASPIIHRMYKLVLCFSVGLQLATFFTLVSATLWIAKIVHGSYAMFAEHRTLYLVAFVIVLVIEIPWLFLGWICVRKECKIRFGVFLFLSAVLVAISSVMFSSNLYRCIFMAWSFFATVTVTAFVMLVLTAALGVLCYFNYGKGLAHYLKVTEALEGSDFTPVYFPRGSDDEKGVLGESQLMTQYYDADIKIQVVDDDIEKNNSTDKKQSRPPVSFPFATLRPNNAFGKKRGSSIYSNKTEGPIILSASPPLLSDLSSLTTYARTIKRLTRAKSKDQSSLTTESSYPESPTPSSDHAGSPTTEEGNRPQLIVVNKTPRQSTVLIKKPPRAAGVGIKPLITAGAANSHTATTTTRIPSMNTVSTFRPFSVSASTAAPGSTRTSLAASLKSRADHRGDWGSKAPIEELPTIPTKF
ncbi:hypothetical protein MD484_g5063, partial [Candolleomyces efflorescens]